MADEKPQITITKSGSAVSYWLTRGQSGTVDVVFIDWDNIETLPLDTRGPEIDNAEAAVERIADGTRRGVARRELNRIRRQHLEALEAHLTSNDPEMKLTAAAEARVLAHLTKRQAAAVTR